MYENLRIGFYKHIDKETTQPVVVEREFKKKEYDEMREGTKVLWEVHSLYMTWSLVLNNYTEYLSYSEKNETLKTHPKVYMGGVNSYEKISEISRLTINLLATASTFLVVSQRLMKDFFGKKSNYYKEWDGFRQDLHASSTPYKVCYELRNFSQHYEIPISGANLNFKGGSYTGCNPFVTIKELLDSGYDWRKLKEVLESLDKEVCLSKLLADYYDCLHEIFLKTHKFFEEKLEISKSVINKVIINYGLPKDIVPIVFTLDSIDGDYNNMHQEHMPVSVHKFIDGIVNGF